MRHSFWTTMLVFFSYLFFSSLLYFPLQTPQGGTTGVLQPLVFVYFVVAFIWFVCFLSFGILPLSFFFIWFINITYTFFLRSSVARVPHDDEPKHCREHRRSVMGGGIRKNGDGGGSGRRETADDEIRKETADSVARYQTDYVVRTCTCYSYHKLPRLAQWCFVVFRFSCSFRSLLVV